MKKIICFFLTVCISLVLSSCGSSAPSAAPDETTDAETVTTATSAKKAEPQTTKQTEETVAETEAPDDDIPDGYKALYKAFLLENPDGADMFDLYDIDSDDTPELFVSGGAFHGAGVKVYAASDDDVICISEGIGSWGVALGEKNNMISGGGLFQGAFFDAYYIKEGNSLKEVIKFDDISETISYHEGKATDAYFINDEPVSEEEYIEKSNEYGSYGKTDNRAIQIGRRFNTDKASLDKVFADKKNLIRSPSGYLLDPCNRVNNSRNYDRHPDTAFLMFSSENARVYGVSADDPDDQLLIIEHDGIAEEFDRMCYTKWGYVEVGTAKNNFPAICTSIVTAAGTGTVQHVFFYFQKDKNDRYKMYTIDEKEIAGYINEHAHFEIDESSKTIRAYSDVSDSECSCTYGEDFEGIEEISYVESGVNDYTLGHSVWYDTYPFAVKAEKSLFYPIINIRTRLEITFGENGEYSFGGISFSDSSPW